MTKISTERGYRDRLHDMVDRLSYEDVRLAYSLLLRLSVSINPDDEDVKDWAPEADNSPLTDEEKELIKRAEKEIANGELVDWEEIK
jgi:hypothetical protein